jgi:hypothetical protein
MQVADKKLPGNFRGGSSRTAMRGCLKPSSPHRWKAGTPQRCADDLLHGFARALETVRRRNTVDQNVEIDRPFDSDDVVDHGAKVAAVSHFIVALTIGSHDDARIGLNVESDRSGVGFDGD